MTFPLWSACKTYLSIKFFCMGLKKSPQLSCLSVHYGSLPLWNTENLILVVEFLAIIYKISSIFITHFFSILMLRMSFKNTQSWLLLWAEFLSEFQVHFLKTFAQNRPHGKLVNPTSVQWQDFDQKILKIIHTSQFRKS